MSGAVGEAWGRSTGRPQVDQSSLIEFARELVRIPSVNRPEEGLSEAPAAELVAEKMRALGWDPDIEEVTPGRPNVITRIEGGLPGPTLLFEGHTDVVTEGDRADWTHDPYGAELVEGRIYGRGAADMKGGVSAMVHAVAAVAAAGPFPGTIILAVLCDEEEMMLGVTDFIRRGHAGGVDGVIVCEPEGGEVCAAQKGALRLLADVNGRMAHGAMPHEGRNPIQAVGQLLAAASEIEEGLQRAHGEHRYLGLPFITPTFIAGGSVSQMNVIAPRASVAFDIRTIPGIDHDEVAAAFAYAAMGITTDLGVSISFTRLVDRCSTETPHSDPIVQAVFQAHREVTGEEPSFGGVPGSTDGTILWRDAGLPVVVYGPGGKWIAHQVDEYVEVDDLIRSAQVYAVAAMRFLGQE